MRLKSVSARRAAGRELIEDATLRLFELEATKKWVERFYNAVPAGNTESLKSARLRAGKLIVLRETLAAIDTRRHVYRHNRGVFLQTLQSLRRRG